MVGGPRGWTLLEKSRRLIKVPPLTAVFDVPGVAALNSISSNPILLSTCRLLGQGKGGLAALALWVGPVGLTHGIKRRRGTTVYSVSSDVQPWESTSASHSLQRTYFILQKESPPPSFPHPFQLVLQPDDSNSHIEINIFRVHEHCLETMWETVSRDFRPLVFFINQLPLGPW
jgi:hypothetical protein